MTIRPARRADRDTIVRLLELEHLQTEDLDPSLSGFMIAEQGSRTVGGVGLERLGEKVALLRSLVVDRSARRAGVGGALIEALVRSAKDLGLESMFLLTTDAEDYFASRGFAQIKRSRASKAVRASREMADLCPVDAALMVLHLD